MTDLSSEAAVTARGESEAQTKSAWLVFAVTVLAAGGASLSRGDGWTRGSFLRNAALAAAAWCALIPGFRRGGSRFGSRYHWTSFLFMPAAILTVVTLLAMWEILTS